MGLSTKEKAAKRERAVFAMKNGADLNEAAARVGLTPSQLDRLLWSGIGSKSAHAVAQQERAIKQEAQPAPKRKSKTRGPDPKHEARNETIVMLRKLGAGPAEIAGQLGLTRNVVLGVLFRAGLTDNQSRLSHHTPRPRVTDQERDRRIVAAYQSGASSVAIGKAEGVSGTVIWAALKRAGVQPRPAGFDKMSPERRREIARRGVAARWGVAA